MTNYISAGSRGHDAIGAIAGSVVRRIRREAKNETWRGWIEKGPLHIYLRLTDRHINGKKYATLDIANISIDPKFQNKGIFSDLLGALETRPVRGMIYVENIVGTSLVNQMKLCGYLERRGYAYHGESNSFTPCMFKVTVGGCR